MIPANAGLALLAALLWGGADFSGGMGVGAAGGKTLAALRVVMLSHLSSLTVLLTVVLLRHEPMPHGALLGWGLLAGGCGAVSVTSFYIALSRGGMGASAAVSGLLAAAIPAGVSIMLEGKPSMHRLVGFVVAAAAIWLIAAGPAAAPASGPSPMPLAILAGLGFGVYFTALRMDNPLGVWMPMVLGRVGSLVTCGVTFLFLITRGGKDESRFTARVIAWALAAGAVDTAGNLLFIAATRAGRLDVAAVLASLYPASTILLAAWLLKERLTRRQVVGMGIAVGAVVLITG